MHEVEQIDFKNQKVWLADRDRRDIASWELMQSTWLKDKNGEEIYEGDILQIKNSMYEVCRDKRYLEYYIRNEGYSGWMHSYAHYEVVGNIYENPELISS